MHTWEVMLKSVMTDDAMFRQKYFIVLSIDKKLIQHLPYPKVNYVKDFSWLYEIS